MITKGISIFKFEICWNLLLQKTSWNNQPHGTEQLESRTSRSQLSIVRFVGLQTVSHHNKFPQYRETFHKFCYSREPWLTHHPYIATNAWCFYFIWMVPPPLSLSTPTHPAIRLLASGSQIQRLALNLNTQSKCTVSLELLFKHIILVGCWPTLAK